MMEWRPVKGYEGIYEVSQAGEIRNVKKRNILTQKVGKIGYPIVQLSRNNKQTTKSVHRILAHAFLTNPFNLPTVNHIDGNKQNNSLSNLEWASYSKNNKHAYETGLKNGHTGRIRIAAKPIEVYNENGDFIKDFPSAFDAVTLGISTASIYRVLNGKRKSIKGFVFKYKEAK